MYVKQLENSVVAFRIVFALFVLINKRMTDKGKVNNAGTLLREKRIFGP